MHLGVNHIYGTLNRGPGDFSQQEKAIRGGGELIQSMMRGSDPSEDALFLKRLEDAKGSQLSNRGLTSTLDARDAMSMNSAVQAQIAKMLNLDPTQVPPEELATLGSFFAQTNSPQLTSAGLSNIGGGVSSRASEAEKLRALKEMNPVLLENTMKLGRNIDLTGDKTAQEILNLGNLNVEDVLNKQAQREQIEATTAGIMLGTGEGGRKERLTEADIGVKGAEKELTQTKTGAIEHSMGISEMLANQDVQNRIDARKNARLLNEANIKNITSKTEQVEAKTQINKDLAVETALEIKSRIGLNDVNQERVANLIENENYESAQEILKLQAETLNVQELGRTRVDLIKTDIRRLEEVINNLIAERGNKENETTSRIKLNDGRTDLVSEQVTTEQVLRPLDAEIKEGQAELLDAKSAYWKNKGKDVISDTMLKQGAGAAGKGSGKGQPDFRKTEAFQRYGRNIEDEGVAYTVTEPGTFWDSTYETHLWPDDDAKLREMMLPFPTDKAEQAKRMQEGKLFLSKAGNYPEESQAAILKSILQVKKN